MRIRLMLTRWLLVVGAMFSLANSSSKETEITVTNCPTHFGGRFEGEHESAGPFKLIAAHCIQADGLPGHTSPVMSPDGSSLAWLKRDEVALADLNSGTTKTFAAPRRSIGFAPGDEKGEPPVGWTSDSAAVWSTTQEVLQPSRFPISGMSLLRLTRDGSAVAARMEPSSAGPLDAVQWIRNSSFALAQFGTNGSYYRPPHSDRAPELAMIDADRGKILDRLPLDTLQAFRRRNPGFDARFSVSAATAVVNSGRIRAVVVINAPDRQTWVHWEQGLPAVELSAPFGKERQSRIALLPSGKLTLNTRDLQPDGIQIICEAWNRTCPSVPSPKARTGSLLELREFGTGKLLWALSTTVQEFWRGGTLEVSPDGEYALTSWPEKRDNKTQLALIRLKDGSVEQFIPTGVSGGDAGFTAGGKALWTRLANVVSVYLRTE